MINLLKNLYHENIASLHINMLPRRSYYIPFENCDRHLNVKIEIIRLDSIHLMVIGVLDILIV